MLLAALITSFRTLYDLEPSAADIQQAIDSGDLEARVFQSDLDALKFEWAEGSQIWSGHLLDPGEFAVVVAFILPQVKRGLEVEPVAGVDPEEAAQPRGGVGRDRATAGEDFAEAALRDAGGLGCRQLGDAHRHEKLIVQDDAGVQEGEFGIHVRCGFG